MMNSIMSDKEWVDRYLEQAAGGESTMGGESDALKLKTLMLREGMGVYKAASAVVLKDRPFPHPSFHTLLYHAREIAYQIYQDYDQLVSKAVEEISSGNAVHLPADLLPHVRKACQSIGISIKEDTRVRRDG